MQVKTQKNWNSFSQPSAAVLAVALTLHCLQKMQIYGFIFGLRFAFPQKQACN